MNLYIFIRKEGFYPLELRDDNDARANAECNPGTTRVEDAGGRIVWPANSPGGEAGPGDSDPERR